MKKTQISELYGSVNQKGIQPNKSDAWPDKFCQKYAIPTEILTKSNVLDLFLTSSDQPQNQFWITWHTVGCGGVILNDKTEITVNVSRDFVQESDFSQCSWQIRAPIGKLVRVQVNTLLMPELTNAQHINDGLFVGFLKFTNSR